MKKRDKRYDLIQLLVKEGKIRTFQDIFQYQKKTIVAKDLGKRGPRFDFLITRVEKFTIQEMMIIAHKCDLSFEQIMHLVKVQMDDRAKLRDPDYLADRDTPDANPKENPDPDIR